MNVIKLIFFIPVFFAFATSAQVCNGTLGNPVYTIDFGAGNNAGPPLSQVPAPYQHTAADCPEEGYYAVRNSTFFCFNDAWHVIPFDHTPNDPVGYFLMVNALAGPSLIYQQTISGLCPNTVFELSAWIINLLKKTSCNGNGIKPELLFSLTDLSGNSLGQITTGMLPETDQVSWKNFGFLFTSPSNGTVVLKITSLAGGGCGNEFGVDDISFRPCGPDISISFPNNVQQLTLCESTIPNITFNSSIRSLPSNPVLQWQELINNNWTNISGATGSTFTINTPIRVGQHSYRLTVANASQAAISSCQFASNVLNISVAAVQSFVQATIYQYGCIGGTSYLFASGGILFEWTGPNGFYSTEQRPQISNLSFRDTGWYTVKVTNVAGCADYASVFLPVAEAPIATMAQTDISICEGDSIQLQAGGSTRYLWSPATGLSNDTIANPLAKPQHTTVYTVSVFNKHNCADTASVRVTVWKKPKAYAGPDKFVRKGKSVQLESGISGSNVSYSWWPPDYLDNPQLLQPKAAPTTAMVYTLTVTSNTGCGTSTDEVKVEVIDKLFIPTAFTPNNDGLNDRWEIITIEEYPNAMVEVFNRYGQRVYKSSGKNYVPWDGTFQGKPALPGVYVYVINLHNNTALHKGTLLLIR